MMNKTLEKYFALAPYEDRDAGPTIDYTSDFIDWDSDNSILSITMQSSVRWAVVVLDNHDNWKYATVAGNVASFDFSEWGNNGDTFRADEVLFYFGGDDYGINITAEKSIIITSASHLIGDEGGPETTSLYLVKEASGSTQTILTGVNPVDFVVAKSKPDIIMTPANTDKKYLISAGVGSSIEAKPDTDTWIVFDPYLLDQSLYVFLPEVNERGAADLNNGKIYLQNVDNIWLKSDDPTAYNRIYGNLEDNEIFIDAPGDTVTSVWLRDISGPIATDGGNDILHGDFSKIYAFGWADTIAFDHLHNASLHVDLRPNSNYFDIYTLTQYNHNGEVIGTFENFANHFTTIIGTPNADRIIGYNTALTIKGAGGRDYVVGSTKDDTFELPLFIFVDGKEGIDTLITPMNQWVDLFDGQLKNIEVLDITQAFDLDLTARDIKGITDGNNTLTIEGDSDDKITLYSNMMRVPSNKSGYDCWRDVYDGFNHAVLFVHSDVHVAKATPPFDFDLFL